MNEELSVKVYKSKYGNPSFNGLGLIIDNSTKSMKYDYESDEMDGYELYDKFKKMSRYSQGRALAWIKKNCRLIGKGE